MNDDSGRARFLARVSAALGRNGAVVDPSMQSSITAGLPLEAEGARDLPMLAGRFRDELAAVSGETIFVPDVSTVDAEVARIVQSCGLGPASSDLAKADYAILHAEALIADTGSAVVIERTADRRLAPYMPRTCIVVADAAALHPTISSASLAALQTAARQGDRGEAVIITGPARTADIEKTLVLGAHGPRHLFVIVYGVAPGERAS